MKKILLSVVVLFATLLTANADALYTATGYVRSAVDENLDSLVIGQYVWGVYSPLKTLDEPRSVEVYEDSVIVKDWYGYGNTSTGEPYDLVCYLNAEKHITGYTAKVGNTLYPYGNYVYTGYSDNYCVGFSKWTETYGDYTQYVSNDSTKSGYMFLYGTEWNSGKAGYYFISWGDQEFDKSLYTYTATGNVRSAIEENNDTLIIGNYTWGIYQPLVTLSDRTIEINSDSLIVKDWYGYGNTSTGDPYDLVCYLDEDGHITSYSAKVGSTLYPYGNYVYTGYSDNYCVGFSAWSEEYGDYTQLVNDPVSQSGYLFIYGTEWNSGNAGYYFLPWGDYKFETTTGISSAIVDVNKKETPVYNLAGQRVGASAKGLLIKNGKKYFVK